MQRKRKRPLRWLLILVMTLSLLPLAARAELGGREAAQTATMSEAEDAGAEAPVDEEGMTEGTSPDDPAAGSANGISPDVGPSEESLTPDTGEETPGEEADEPHVEALSLKDEIAVNSYAYVTTMDAVDVYADVETAGPAPLFCITEPGAVLLATAYVEQAEGGDRVKIWLISQEMQSIEGYVPAQALSSSILSFDAVNELMGSLPYALVPTEAGELPAFVVAGQAPVVPDEIIQEPENPGEDTAVESTAVPEAVPSPTAEPDATLEPVPTVDTAGQPEQEEPPFPAQVGDFVAVTPSTRVFLGVDDTAADGYDGDLNLGCFVCDASVQVEAVCKDGWERYWYQVRFLYGAEDANVDLSDYDSLFVFASETAPSAGQSFTATDYAFTAMPNTPALLSLNDYALKAINGAVGPFAAGQTNRYASSGHDSEYKQIAKLPGYGTIYATPHYLEGYTIYCLEHTMNSPGVRDYASGPYAIVDLDGYAQVPGYSGIVFSDRTMHAIGWVLRHTYPFAVLDRGDADNEVWSRVAGQFAIREVVKHLEGAQYVRDYWDMDNFYAASGQAPGEYLEYARWLAAQGIARGRITGEINVSDKSVSVSNGICTGIVKLTTDADRIRIRRSAGTVTGHTGGEDGNYYYLHSGDTISVSSPGSGFSFTAESISSTDEEANFLIGVPQADIQKILIPQHGEPYPMQSIVIQFEVPYGALHVSKTDAQSDAMLAGAVFELLEGAARVVQTQTTGANGVATFSDLNPGSYTVREKNAPQGYTVSVPNTQGATVTAGHTTSLTFSNERITGKIRIVKKDQLTKEPLAGATFTVTRLSAPPADQGAGVGTVVAVITTDTSGTAETGWLDWGRYRIEETGVPEHYADNRYSTEIDAYEDGKTYTIEVENEPTKGFIKLTKTDRQNGNPIEGVRFDIYNDDEYGSGLASTMVTGKDGVAVSEPLRKGRYIVREHGETAGYVFEKITLGVTVKSDETTELQATNQPVRVKLKIYKRDAEEYAGDATAPPATRGDGVLTGAEFEVLAGANIIDRQGNVLYAKGDVVVESLKTMGDDASVTTDELWPGLYEIVELAPPAGYQSAKPIRVDARDAAKQSQEAVVPYEGVVADKILYGGFEIVKFIGDNQVHPEAGVVETPEKGAEFEVYLKSAGSYENARECERDTLVTNRYGKARTKALPYGVYVLRQTVGQEGHAVMRPLEVMIDGTEDLHNPPALILNNQAIHYRLRIVKVDAQTGNPIALAGTAFKLRDADGNYVTQTIPYPAPLETDTFLTDESGAVTLPETVTWGQYFIEEAQSPEGYLLCAEPVPVFVGHAGDAPDEVYEVVAEIPNEPVKGRILVEKKGLRLTGFQAVTDAYGNEVQRPVFEERPLAGAVFELRAADNIIGKEGTAWYEKDALVDTILTSAEGADASKLLPLGRYYLVEVQAPKGYKIDARRHEVELAYMDDQTAVVEITAEIGNDYLPAEISLQKEKESLQAVRYNDGTIGQVVHNVPGKGFVFGLYNDDDIHFDGGTIRANTLVATGITDTRGKLTFSGRFPHGDYYIRELAAPEGWKLNAERFEITLDPAAAVNGVVSVALPDAVHNELIYTSATLTKTDITGGQALPGALIEVRDEAGEIVYRAYTDANGQIPEILVVPGTYTFRETLAPSGYALSEAEMSFTVHTDGSVTGDTVIRDDYTRFSLRKQDENGNPLAGVAFTLTQDDGSWFFTAVTDEHGAATFERIPYGDYTIAETQPLPGYLQNDTEIHLTVDGSFVNPSEPVATVTNRPNEIILHKVDPEGNPLAGAAFVLLNESGNEIMSATSDESGVARFGKIPSGQYIIREAQAPDSYERMEDLSVRVDEAWTEAAHFTCVNEPTTPDIQTGVDIKMTPVMQAGVGLIFASFVLFVAYGVMRRRKRCRHR